MSLDIVSPFVEFAFMRRALVGCVAVGLGAAPVGVFLMLRRMSLTGDAMAHAILPGAAAGYLLAGLSLSAMTVGGLIAGILVALAAGAVSRTTILREDASLAAFYLISLAIGVTMISAGGNNLDLMHILFGSVLALDDDALILLCAIATLTLLALAVLYRPLVMECLDPHFLRGVSRLSFVAHFGFLALAVVNLVGAFHALGTLMAVGMMVLPAASARFWAVSVGALAAVAVLFALLASVAGLLLSFHFNQPSGPAIILVLGAFYVVSLLCGPHGSLAARFWPRSRHLEA
ncbi:metal ABC transporter permease [Acuticoccus sp. MNP-M23]|uniref:metal ABC transporter permease n=1 Tax=Acuticoccus sp. MNP-M23 TaxID=3072793 RepID=UPI0028157EFA|nr:metal ABC transporter permease [Acuticoccus sp. MNP-M23]WMS42485.1 metal ABC transporter permease [Acuticoccus sp. MNP-M23]